MSDTEYKILVTLTNEDEGHTFSEWDESVPDHLTNEDGTPDMGAIYRASQQDFGRCTSSVYVEREGKPPLRIGWFFVSRERYDDTQQPYLRGAWVTVAEVKPATLRYLEVGR